jgi:preprotein translocase subunit SecF
MLRKNTLIHWYDTYNRKLMLITIALVLLALVQIGAQYAITGDFVHKGVSLKGGATITVTTAVPADDLSQSLTELFPRADIKVRSLTQAGTQIGLMIDADAQEEEIAALVNAVKDILAVTEDDLTVEIIGSSLGESFFRQTIAALAVAFILMGIVVLIYFRTIVPSFAVVIAAASDIIVTLAIFNVTGVSLTTAGIAAFLMLIGYSVDTDMLLTTKVLKKRDKPFIERVIDAMKTGTLMTATTLTVVIVALIVTTSAVIKQIMIILAIGLTVDYLMTWIQNVGILRWYLEK